MSINIMKISFLLQTFMWFISVTISEDYSAQPAVLHPNSNLRKIAWSSYSLGIFAAFLNGP